MKKLWLKGGNSKSRKFLGGVVNAVTYDDVDLNPAPVNDRGEVLLDQEDGLVRYYANFMETSGQLEWRAEKLVQELGGFYKVFVLDYGCSRDSAREFSQGALAACEIAMNLRQTDYQPHGEPVEKKTAKRKKSSVKKSSGNSRGLTAEQKALIEEIF